MIKVVNVLNVLSIFLFSAILLLVYAYLPISVNLNVEGLSAVHRQTFFYYIFGSFVGINVLIRIATSGGQKSMNSTLFAWIRLIIFIINFYLTTLVGFIGVLNNSTHINPESYNYLMYLGPILLAVWIIGLFFLIIKSR